MTWFTVWTTAGWAILLAILLGSAILAFLLWQDTKKKAARNISAPDIHAASTAPELVLTEDSPETPNSRRATRRSAAQSVKVEDASESSLWSSSDDFDLSEGKD